MENTLMSEAARLDHALDHGFEAGSRTAANVILAYLVRVGEDIVADKVRKAWDDGSITGEPAADGHLADTLTAIGDIRLTKHEARQQGFTGDACDHCGSMKMQVTGHCTTCAECGTTTGCS